MKKILLFAGIFLFTTVCATPPLGSDEFTEWSKFEGIYGNIYNDLFAVDETVICERVLEWPDFWDTEKEEQIFSLEDCEDFATTGKLSDFVDTLWLSKVATDRWMQILHFRYEFEKQLWKDEYDLQRRLALSSIWNDGDGGGETPKKRTSPVDLVVRWNEIDQILFGIMAEYPEFASFTESEDEVLDPWAETPEEDEWLDQRADKKPVYGYLENAYPEGELSLSGGYEEQAEMFEKDINSNSLIPGRATTQTFDMAFTGKPIQPSTGMHVDTAPTPAESPDEPEQITILEQKPMGEMEGIFAKFFREQSVAEVRGAKTDSLISEGFTNLNMDTVERDRAFVEKIDLFLRIRSETRDKDTGQLELLPLSQFNTVLATWITTLDKWQKVNKLFLKNDAK